MKKLFQSKAIAIVLALVMVFAMSSTAFASNSDPNMTDFTGQFTYVVNAADITADGADVNLAAGPANSSWAYTGFSTEAAANDVTWSVVDGSTSGVAVSSSEAMEVDTDQYVSYATVHIDSDVLAGSASIVATNEANDASVNFTVLVNPTDPQTATVSASFEVYEPGSSVTSTAIATGTTAVSAIDYNSSRNFVTAMDGMPAMMTAGIINSYASPYGYVSRITVNNTAYEPAYPAGWQYRIYREGGTAGTYTMVGISSVLGADDIQLQAGDIVQWRAGNYNADLFPTTIER